MSVGTPLPKPGLHNKSFADERSRPCPPERTIYLVARGRRARGLVIPNHFHVGRGVVDHRNRTVPSSQLHLATALLPSWRLRHLWKSLGTNPSFAAIEHEVHLELQSPVRCQGRISFHRASSAHSEQQPGWGQGLLLPTPHPDGRVSAASSWSLLSFWHRLREPPRVANVSSTALQRFLPGVASPLPGTTRGHGPRRT